MLVVPWTYTCSPQVTTMISPLFTNPLATASLSACLKKQSKLSGFSATTDETPLLSNNWLAVVWELVNAKILAVGKYFLKLFAALPVQFFLIYSFVDW